MLLAFCLRCICLSIPSNFSLSLSLFHCLFHCLFRLSQIARRLTEAGLLDSLQLLHFHIGSQISNISVIKNALREAGQFYAQLAKLGANMQYMVCGPVWVSYPVLGPGLSSVGAGAILLILCIWYSCIRGTEFLLEIF